MDTLIPWHLDTVKPIIDCFSDRFINLLLIFTVEPSSYCSSGHHHPGPFMQVINEDFADEFEGAHFNGGIHLPGNEIGDDDGGWRRYDAPGETLQDAANVRLGSIFCQIDDLVNSGGAAW